MTAEIAGVSPELLEYLRSIPERCSFCGFHIEIQGHRGGCQLTGERLRDEGMDATTEAHPGDVAIVDAAIDAACRKGEPFSANDFRHLVDRVEQPAVIGARIRSWLASKRIKRVGDTPSTSPGTHAHRIGCYVPTERWSA